MEPSISQLEGTAEAITVAEAIPERSAGFARWLIPALAGAWSLFQLSLAFLVISSDIVRVVHLVFAISLVFLSYPLLKKPRKGRLGALFSDRSKTPIPDAALAVMAALSAAYFALDYVGISGRQGLPITRDFILGIALLILLLEAARRALGPALPTIAFTFIVLCLCGPDLPDFIAFRRVTPAQLLGQLTMSTEGVYGVPLYVSASMVYLFVLFGAILERTGGGHYFVQLAFSLLGGFRGGPAKAAVLASGLTGLVSGSSIANTVTTGTFTIPLMKRCGYPAVKAAAVEVAASTNGQLMPPIMGAAAFIIAERCNLPYLSVVRAAFVPAVVSYLALIFITHLEACKLGLKGMPREELPVFRTVLVGGLHFLIPLGLLIILLVQRYSPQLAAFWSIIVLAGTVTIREAALDLRKGRGVRGALIRSGILLWKSLVAGGKNMMGIGVAVAAAGIIVGVMTLGPGSLVTELIGKLSGGRLSLVLLLTAATSLVLGMGLPTTANYIVVSTLVAPTILTLSGNAGLAVPVIAAHLFCFFFGILADDTPPVGLAAYAAAAIAKSNPIATGVQGFLYDMRTALLPFMFFFNTDLLLIGIHSPLHMLLIFVTATIAMFAFASLTQNYLLCQNALHESGVLIAVTAILLRPDLFVDWLNLPGKWVCYTVGSLGYALVMLLQHLRQGSVKKQRQSGK
ncbi:MAG: TRAP transporter permease [Lentisphaerae bacterium]|jgi:TRAP transporter 4TM/12TM fusion protein|nr:TRAP transporter permease [Lentisphaerota bacterium]MBT4821280.1 TRAP transporter permease [Lentisphaerota bacterium]MBT5604420.1 TRAP transporter permease [Lentisphaerota bacterium]MBT7058177.1 TRAP transporter permease [Lentisphaerota bacterium]MBT7847439.1 TRAP transporter permease [Lentisphaerota bacterium]